MRPLIRPLRIRRLIIPLIILCCIVGFLRFPIDSQTDPVVTTFKNGSHDSISVMVPPKIITSKNTTTTSANLPQVKAPELSQKQQRITQEEISGGQPQNETLVEIRNQIREMTKHAWASYVKYAWGYNELKPLSKKGHQPSVLGAVPLGTTIIDGMDTLYIMGLRDEFNAARKYVAEELNFDRNTMVSVFEYTIRYLGGLLTAYTFTLDDVFLVKAVELARRLLPAFDTPTNIPRSLINLKTHEPRMFSWSRNKCAILSEAGTLHMEFKYLSELTGDPIYAEKVDAIRSALVSLERPDGLFYNFVDHRKPEWCARIASLGALGDSFYEYLLKEWIRTDHSDTQAWSLYNSSMEALYKNGLFKRSPGGHLFLGTYETGFVSNRMEHLACFAGGMLALGAPNKEDIWFQRAVELTETCNHSYAITPTQLGPEVFEFSTDIEGVPVQKGHRFYALRPETVESYFYMWRFTKDEKYRVAALKIVQALQQYSRTEAGFSGLNNVYSAAPAHDDVQQSFFLAETLKYLYLIFSEDTLLPLDRWVFNSEAHPFPIRNRVDLGLGIWPKAQKPKEQ